MKRSKEDLSVCRAARDALRRLHNVLGLTLEEVGNAARPDRWTRSRVSLLMTDSRRPPKPSTLATWKEALGLSEVSLEELPKVVEAIEVGRPLVEAVQSSLRILLGREGSIAESDLKKFAALLEVTLDQTGALRSFLKVEPFNTVLTKLAEKQIGAGKIFAWRLAALFALYWPEVWFKKVEQHPLMLMAWAMVAQDVEPEKIAAIQTIFANVRPLLAQEQKWHLETDSMIWQLPEREQTTRPSASA